MPSFASVVGFEAWQCPGPSNLVAIALIALLLSPPQGSDTHESSSGRRLAPDLLQLYQVLSPCLVSRARVFGSKLSLKEEWIAVDVPYFSATGVDLGCEGRIGGYFPWMPLPPSDIMLRHYPSAGTLSSPLSPLDKVPPGLPHPAVTTVFAMVDGGKQYAMLHRRDGLEVHLKLDAVMTSVLRQVGVYKSLDMRKPGAGCKYGL